MKDLNLLREQINSSNRAERLKAARELGEAIKDGSLSREMLQEVNNHVHTTYSYSPTNQQQLPLLPGRRGWGLWGQLTTTQLEQPEEMLEASALSVSPSTVGFEVRSGFQKHRSPTRR